MTMIKKLAFAGAVAALGFAASPALADPYTAPSADATATVRLFDAISFDKVTDIDFGVVIRDSTYTGGTSITMDAAGATNCTSVLGLSCTGATSAGEFTLKGDTGSEVSISMSSADFDPVTKVMSLRNGADSLALSLVWTGMTQDLDVSAAGTNNFSLTGTGANQTISLYGDLAVKGSTDAPNGVYEASFSLTADYK